MTDTHDTLTVFAPAKLNLFLHIAGRRTDGYHLLQSLAAFADIGDTIRIRPAPVFSFAVEGPFAPDFPASESGGGLSSQNLAARAVCDAARLLGRDPLVAVTLVKNLPLASGMGGGSADAAAALWGLLELWGVMPQAVPGLEGLMRGLGADVPVCFSCRPALMEGIGDIVTPVPFLPEVPVILVNPLKPCPTPAVYGRYDAVYGADAAVPRDFADVDALLDFLAAQENMLTAAAAALVPEIAFVLGALEGHPACRLARMSGSGATCFGLFADAAAAGEAAAALAAAHPDWWVRAGTLNRPARY